MRVSAIVGVPDVQVVFCAPVDDVLTAIDVLGVPAVARISAIAILLSAAGVSNLFGVPAVPGDSAIVGFPAALTPFC